MRARILTGAGLVIAVTAACSDVPSRTSSGSADPQFADELELALFGADAAATNSAVVMSPIELAHDNAPGESPRVAPPAQHDHSLAASPEPVALLGIPVATIAMGGAPTAVSIPEDEMAGAVTIPSRGGVSDDGRDGVDVRPSGGSIIIRGGVSGRDPCAIHLPGRGGAGDVLGAIGVLINERAPRVGVSGPENRGRTSIPRRGAIFAGGIR